MDRTPLSLSASTAALLVVLAAAGCGGGERPDDAAVEPTPAPRTAIGPVTAEQPSTRMVLYVSNQSFDEPRMRLRITLDGEPVVDQDFDVEGQHTWVQFPVQVPVGRPLDLVVESGSGERLRRSIVARADVERGVVVNYWAATEPQQEGPMIEATVMREPIAFA